MARKEQRVEAVKRQLLRDIQKLASRQFVYEDGWCGMVPFDGKLTEMQSGPPVGFAELTWREQADVLRSFIHWDRYPERAWNDEYTIRENIAAGKRPQQWVDGTSLRQSFQLLADGKTPPVPKRYLEISEQEFADLRDALRRAEVDRPDVEPKETKLSLRELQRGSPEEETRASQGLQELRKALSPSRESVADTEIGVHGTTQGEIADARLGPGQGSQQESRDKTLSMEELRAEADKRRRDKERAQRDDRGPERGGPER